MHAPQLISSVLQVNVDKIWWDQNHSEISNLVLVRTVMIKKPSDSRCWWGWREIVTLTPHWKDWKMVQSVWKIVQRLFKMLKIEVPYNSAIPHLGMYLKKWRHYVEELSVPHVHCSTICKCPVTDEQIKKLWYICICVSVCVCAFKYICCCWSCPTLCDPMDHGPPGSSVHGSLQVKIL